jgi:hypothetical protein
MPEDIWQSLGDSETFNPVKVEELEEDGLDADPSTWHPDLTEWERPPPRSLFRALLDTVPEAEGAAEDTVEGGAQVPQAAADQEGEAPGGGDEWQVIQDQLLAELAALTEEPALFPPAPQGEQEATEEPGEQPAEDAGEDQAAAPPREMDPDHLFGFNPTEAQTIPESEEEIYPEEWDEADKSFLSLHQKIAPSQARGAGRWRAGRRARGVLSNRGQQGAGGGGGGRPGKGRAQGAGRPAHQR